MGTPTNRFRHVWRDLDGGDSSIKVLALQQWIAADGWEHEDIVEHGGFWEDVPISETADWLDAAPIE